MWFLLKRFFRWLSPRRIWIAVDGPSGSGSSSLAKAIAKTLGIPFVDTGAFFRVIALAAQQASIDFHDESRIVGLLGGLKIKPTISKGNFFISLNGEKIPDQELRTKSIDQGSSIIATSPIIRPRIIELLKSIASKMSVVMEGRNVGISILPNADLKVDVCAEPETRADRRVRQRYPDLPPESPDFQVKLSEVLADINERDKRDRERAIDPVKTANGAFIIDNTNVSLSDEVNLVIQEMVAKGVLRFRRRSIISMMF